MADPGWCLTPAFYGVTMVTVSGLAQLAQRERRRLHQALRVGLRSSHLVGLNYGRRVPIGWVIADQSRGRWRHCVREDSSARLRPVDASTVGLITAATLAWLKLEIKLDHW
ncbi:hypothetical protein FOZ60_012510 [Perkinsus olseni]|uniref:Uncharacterized protein n=2 Tax=Perkinsus olseni TaxID=32597 RepID=A0A7J6P9Q1_PEROL|nr:hypothetical protein FOZ60_012510 [Perkinsus olseni]